MTMGAREKVEKKPEEVKEEAKAKKDEKAAAEAKKDKEDSEKKGKKDKEEDKKKEAVEEEEEGKSLNECLTFKLQGNTDGENIDSWGHEYIRHLTGEIVVVWNELEVENLEMKKSLLGKKSEPSPYRVCVLRRPSLF